MTASLHRLLLVLLVAASAGCVSFPKTENAFRETAGGVHRFVVERSLSDAYEFVRASSMQCYSHQLPLGGSAINGSLREPAGATVSASTSTSVGSGVSMIVDLKSLGPSSTEVSAYYLKKPRAGALVEGWFSGSKDCY